VYTPTFISNRVPRRLATAWAQRVEPPPGTLPAPALGGPVDSSVPPSIVTAPAMPELIVDLSQARVSITSAFQGESLLLFGMFDPPGEIVVVENVHGGTRAQGVGVSLDASTLVGTNVVIAGNTGAGLGGAAFVRSGPLGLRNATNPGNKAGGVLLQLKLWRAWEGATSIVERFTVTAHVQE